MREILFRGRRVEDWEWMYGLLDDEEHDADFTAIIPHRRDQDQFVGWEVDPSTVGQYTGLKDKNGQRIFEGDIVKANNGHVSQVVFWYDGFCMYCDCHRLHSDGVCASIVEVIGNIHDNPELLEGGTDNA